MHLKSSAMYNLCTMYKVITYIAINFCLAALSNCFSTGAIPELSNHRSDSPTLHFVCTVPELSVSLPTKKVFSNQANYIYC